MLRILYEGTINYICRFVIRNSLLMLPNRFNERPVLLFKEFHMANV